MIEKWDGEVPSEKWRDNLISELQDRRRESYSSTAYPFTSSPISARSSLSNDTSR